MSDRPVGPAAAPLEAPASPRLGNVWTGVLSGLAGGLLMLVFLSVCAAFAGLGWLQPLEAIGATAVNNAAGSLTAAVAGLVLHAIVSAFFGAVFASLLPDDFPGASSVIAGAGYGLFVTGVMLSLVVPSLSPEFRSAAQPIGGSWVIAHCLFGGTLAYALVIRRRTRSRRAHASQQTGSSLPARAR